MKKYVLWPLLAAAAGQTQKASAPHVAEPVCRNRLHRRQKNLEFPLPRPCDPFCRHRLSPDVSLTHFLIPGATVVEKHRIIVHCFFPFPSFVIADKVCVYFRFGFRCADSHRPAGSDAFQQPGHVFSQNAHDLHPFGVAADLFRRIAVHHVPVI